ncbi:MAG: VanW family protein [Clostridia bacterium]|nr:VanW family protein [Clostridia bacterium]
MKRMYAFFTISLLLSLLMAAAGCGGRLSDSVKLKNHISIDGVDVSAKTVGQARALLAQAAEARLAETKLSLVLPERTILVPAAQLGIGLDTEGAIEQAAALGRSGGTRIIRSQYVSDAEAMRAASEQIAASYSRRASNASVSIDADAAVPVVYSPEQDGITIDANALCHALEAAVGAGDLSAEIEVPHSVVEPEITLASIQESQSLVAQFTTSFEDAPYNNSNRVYNIQKAAGLINGTVLQPGEEFDCNAVLGDRTQENGWKEAPGIRNGRYENEYGGGVCQVSSTLFNAVMMADLEITERTPHSWPMGYVDIGRDATISTGGKNFRFINSSDEPLYIFVYADEALMQLTASIYGKPLTDGMYIVISSEKTGTLESAGEEIMLDESLPYNTREVMREARDGKTAVTYKEYYSRDGSLLERRVAYEDTYRAIDGLTYVSTDLYYGE